MKSYFVSLIVAAVLLVAGLSESAFAYSFGYEDFTTINSVDYQYGRANASSDPDPLQGLYLGTVYDGNADEATLIDFLIWKGWSADQQITFFGKTDENTFFMPETQTIGDKVASGTWQTYASDAPVPDSADLVDLIIVKGGTSFSVHQYSPSASYGTWNVGYLRDAGGSGSPAEVSYISAYRSDIAPVPEPASILLLGTGLLGWAGCNRRKWMSRKK